MVDRHTDQEELTMTSRTALWTGRVLSGIAVLFLIFDGAIKLVPIQPVTEQPARARLSGRPTLFARFLGVVTLDLHGALRLAAHGGCWARSC